MFHFRFLHGLKKIFFNRFNIRESFSNMGPGRYFWFVWVFFRICHFLPIFL